MQILFNLFSLFYLFRAVQIVIEIGRKWSDLWREPLTREKWVLASNASFFVGVPPAVFLHELGHALAVWLFDGQVIEFAYRVFWGYVVPAGTFTAAESWTISMAGTVGNVLFGVVVWLALRNASSSTMRFFGLQAFRYQLYFGFIYYPVFTLFLPIGDWITIYDFGATPILSSATAVIHLLILLGFWQARRQGWFELPTHETIEEQQKFAEQAETARANPQDLEVQLLHAAALRRGLAPNKARAKLKQLAAQYPNEGAVWLQLAALNRRQDGSVTRKGAEQAQKALDLGLERTESRLFAQMVLGHYAMAREQMKTAVVHLTNAIDEAQKLGASDGKARQLAQLYYLRAQAHRQLEQFDHGLADLETAVRHSQAVDDNPMLEKLTIERRLIEQHPKRTIEN